MALPAGMIKGEMATAGSLPLTSLDEKLDTLITDIHDTTDKRDMLVKDAVEKLNDTCGAAILPYHFDVNNDGDLFFGDEDHVCSRGDMPRLLECLLQAQKAGLF